MVTAPKFSLSRLALASVFVSATALAACSGGSASGAPTSALTEGVGAEAKGEAHVAHFPFLDHALESDAVALRPEQRTALEAVRADLVVKTADSRKEAKAFAELLAKDVEAGKLDRAEVDAQIAKMQAAGEANKPAFQAAMTKVHDTLDMSQRKALVASMHDEHGEWKHHGFHKQMKELDLTSEQKEALHTAMKAERAAHEGDSAAGAAHFKEMKLHMKETADAFVSDGFDAKTVDLGRHAMGAAKWATHAARFVEVAIPILTSEQRALFAKQIRARAEKIGG